MGMRKRLLFNLFVATKNLTEEDAIADDAQLSDSYTLEQFKNDELNEILTTNKDGFQFKPNSSLTLKHIEYLIANPTDEVKQQFFSKFGKDPNFLLFEE